MRAILLAILSVAIIAVYLIDYEYLFEGVMTVQEQPLPKSMGVIDHYLHKYSYSKYKNNIDENIFVENVMVPMESQKKIVSKNNMKTMQLEIWGIATTPENKMVLIWDKEKKQSHVLLEKDVFNNWKVLSINTQEVVLGNESGDIYEVLLNDETGMDLYNIR